MFAATDAGSSGSHPSRPAQPRRIPTTSWPSSVARSVAALMHAFRPGTSPPPVRMPIFIARLRSSKNSSATATSSSGTGRTFAASASGTSPISSPCNATIWPNPPSREVDRRAPEPRRDDPVRRDGRATPLHVPEHRHPRLPAGQLLEIRRDHVGDAAEPRGARGRSGTRAAPSCPRPASPPRPRRRSRRSAPSGGGGGAPRRPPPGRRAAPGSRSCRRLPRSRTIARSSRRCDPSPRPSSVGRGSRRWCGVGRSRRSPPAPRSRTRCTRRCPTGRCRSSWGCRRPAGRPRRRCAAAPIVPSPPMATTPSSPRSVNVRRTRSTPPS